MGKPEPVISPNNAMPLHTQPGQSSYRSAPDLALPVENDDLPPVYDDVAEASGSTDLNAPLLPNYPSSSPPGLPDDRPDLYGLKPFNREASLVRYLDHRLDNDPDFFASRIRQLAALPPRPFVRVHGSHRERHRASNGKDENRSITDFDVWVELTPQQWVDGAAAAAARLAWNEVHTVENGDRALRGTVFRHRAPGRAGRGTGNIELGMVAEKPSLTQWCHMYCASHAGLKKFVLRRKVLGFDQARVRDQIEAMVRRTNYRGRLDVSFPVRDETVEVWNQCRTNEWRLTKWIFTLFCVSMLWLLTWPYLFFRTKKFETVTSEWYFSRCRGEGRKAYVSLSEDQWYNLWGRALSKAVLSKRQGTLDQTDLIAADAPGPVYNTGNSTVDGALGFLRAGANAVTEVNRQLGWGENQC
ncbi:hypothetical protein VMCG_03459 [Cytospora schulzeri]|uniref:Uncharacterized protein n=1 Tax=Cytospora schulzeri TaxID=448051 RepID=A0A423WW85_9PEZI|nr:hypothetical protein VMCG_03459 [Valsa malicola]